MAFAVMWSGGKDSTLALDRLVRAGRDVRFLFNLYDAESRRVRFHGVRRELIQRQAEALRMPLLQRPTLPDTFEAVFLDGLRMLQERGVTRIAFGDIHLADVRAWYEERTTGLGLGHVEPLWGEEPATLVAELLGRRYRAILTSISEPGRREWLGRELDATLAGDITRSGVDPAGEHGEYHTFVFDGPLFTNAIAVLPGDVVEAEGHAQIDLV
jgi:uncharacterized protein (TIGR00290 family)